MSDPKEFAEGGDRERADNSQPVEKKGAEVVDYDLPHDFDPPADQPGGTDD